MTKEEKINLLRRDLGSRIGTGVKLSINDGVYDVYMLGDQKIVAVKLFMSNLEAFPIEAVKPYLRPMASMTDEELYEWQHTWIMDNTIEKYDWLNSHHFDYRGLIELGLAIEAPKDMYGF